MRQHWELSTREVVLEVSLKFNSLNQKTLGMENISPIVHPRSHLGLTTSVEASRGSDIC